MSTGHRGRAGREEHDERIRRVPDRGDSRNGVGQEVVAAGAWQVVDALAGQRRRVRVRLAGDSAGGARCSRAPGRMDGGDAQRMLKSKSDAIYFGAVGWPGVPDHMSLGACLAIRQELRSGADVGPVRFPAAVAEPAAVRPTETELELWVVVVDQRGRITRVRAAATSGRGRAVKSPSSSAASTKVAATRIMRFALRLARTGIRRKVFQRHQQRCPADQRRCWRMHDLRRVARTTPTWKPRAWAGDLASARPRSFVLAPRSSRRGALEPARGHPAPSAAPWPGASAWPPAPTSTPRAVSQADVRARARLRTGHRRKRTRQPHGAVGSAVLMLDHLGLPGQATRLHAAIEADHRGRHPELHEDLGGTTWTRRRHQGPDITAGHLTYHGHMP